MCITPVVISRGNAWERRSAVPIVKIPLERMGMAFPLLSYGENAYILLKMHFAVQNDVFLTLKYGKTRWRPGLRHEPCWGSLRRSPRPPIRLGRGHPSPNPTPSALNYGVPIVVNLRNGHCITPITDRWPRLVNHKRCSFYNNIYLLNSGSSFNCIKHTHHDFRV